jgi:CRISPR/Cas system CSM-associated protein Csm2 small subunit
LRNYLNRFRKENKKSKEFEAFASRQQELLEQIVNLLSGQKKQEQLLNFPTRQLELLQKIINHLSKQEQHENRGKHKEFEAILVQQQELLQQVIKQSERQMQQSEQQLTVLQQVIHQQSERELKQEQRKSSFDQYMKIIKFIMVVFALIWTICIALVVGYEFYSDKVRAKRIANSFKKESNREKDEIIESGRYIPRPDVEQRILDLFEVKGNYVLISGEHAVGESTTVKYAVKKAREHKIPVLYIQANGRKEKFHE